jgi:hypothetical protein
MKRLAVFVLCLRMEGLALNNATHIAGEVSNEKATAPRLGMACSFR